MDWFRSHHGAPIDPKWQLIARRAGVPTCAVVAFFWQLLDYASQHSDRGSIDGFDTEVAAFYLGLEDFETENILCALVEKCVVVEKRLANWDKRQPRRERDDDSADRVRTLRARQKTAQAEPFPSTNPSTQSAKASISQSVVTENVTPDEATHEPCNATTNHVTPCNATKRLDKTRLDKIRLDKRQTTDRPAECVSQGSLESPEASVVGSSSVESVKEKVSGLKGLAYLQAVTQENPSWTAFLSHAFLAANEQSVAKSGKPIRNPLRWKTQVLANWLDGDGTPEEESEKPAATPKPKLVSTLSGDPEFQRWKTNRDKNSPPAPTAASTETSGQER